VRTSIVLCTDTLFGLRSGFFGCQDVHVIVCFRPATFLRVGSLEQFNVNGNKIREIFYPDPPNKSDNALATDKGERA
jgi:hypothetical protein